MLRGALAGWREPLPPPPPLSPPPPELEELGTSVSAGAAPR
jgi:hypothetical protein